MREGNLLLARADGATQHPGTKRVARQRACTLRAVVRDHPVRFGGTAKRQGDAAANRSASVRLDVPDMSGDTEAKGVYPVFDLSLKVTTAELFLLLLSENRFTDL